MKQYIAAQFSDYGIAEAVSHSADRPAGDPCMSCTFVSGKAGEDFHVTVGWYDWDKVRKFFHDEQSMRESPDAEVEILDEAAVVGRVAAYTRFLLSLAEDGSSEYTAFRMVIVGEEDTLRGVLVLYNEGDSVIESLTDEELWNLDVTMFDNNAGYSREEFLQFRTTR